MRHPDPDQADLPGRAGTPVLAHINVYYTTVGTIISPVYVSIWLNLRLHYHESCCTSYRREIVRDY